MITPQCGKVYTKEKGLFTDKNRRLHWLTKKPFRATLNGVIASPKERGVGWL
jgi:hypothetical protein